MAPSTRYSDPFFGRYMWLRDTVKIGILVGIILGASLLALWLGDAMTGWL